MRLPKLLVVISGLSPISKSGMPGPSKPVLNILEAFLAYVKS